MASRPGSSTRAAVAILGATAVLLAALGTTAAAGPAQGAVLAASGSLSKATIAKCDVPITAWRVTGTTPITRTTVAERVLVAEAAERLGRAIDDAGIAGGSDLATEIVEEAVDRWAADHGYLENAIALEQISPGDLGEYLQEVAAERGVSGCHGDHPQPGCMWPPPDFDALAVEAVLSSMPAGALPAEMVFVFEQNLSEVIPNLQPTEIDDLVALVQGGGSTNGGEEVLPLWQDPNSVVSQVALSDLPLGVLGFPLTDTIDEALLLQAMAEAIPSNAIPSNAIPSNGIPSNQRQDVASEALGGVLLDALPSSWIPLDGLYEEMVAALVRELGNNLSASNEAIPSNLRQTVEGVVFQAMKDAGLIGADALPSSALPSNALPASAIPSPLLGDKLLDRLRALPASALPSSALPASALPASALPSSALPSSMMESLVEGAMFRALPASALPSSLVTSAALAVGLTNALALRAMDADGFEPGELADVSELAMQLGNQVIGGAGGTLDQALPANLANRDLVVSPAQFIIDASGLVVEQALPSNGPEQLFGPAFSASAIPANMGPEAVGPPRLVLAAGEEPCLAAAYSCGACLSTTVSVSDRLQSANEAAWAQAHAAGDDADAFMRMVEGEADSPGWLTGELGYGFWVQHMMATGRMPSPNLIQSGPDPFDAMAGDYSGLAGWQDAGWSFVGHDAGYTASSPDGLWSFTSIVKVVDPDAYLACVGDDKWALAALATAGYSNFWWNDLCSGYTLPDGRGVGSCSTSCETSDACGGGIPINTGSLLRGGWDWLGNLARDFFGLDGEGATLTVPDLMGLSFADAESVLGEAGFRICACEQANCCRGDTFVYDWKPVTDPDQVDRVVAQYPAAGFVVQQDQAREGVTFWIGEEDTSTDTTTGTTAGTTSTSTTPGTTSTSTTPGTTSTSSTSPTTTSSSTTAPSTTVTLKNYYGWQCESARADLQSLGLVAPPCEDNWYTYEGWVGTVNSQDPHAGAVVLRGSTVYLFAAYEVAPTQQICEAPDLAGIWEDGTCKAP